MPELCDREQSLKSGPVVTAAAILPGFKVPFPSKFKEWIELSANEAIQGAKGFVQSCVPAQGNEMLGPIQNWHRPHMEEYLGNEAWIGSHLLGKRQSQGLELHHVLSQRDAELQMTQERL